MADRLTVMTTDQTDLTVHCTGSFTVDSWDQDDGDPAGGVTTSRARVAKTFSGDLTATSVTELVLVGADSGIRAYCGFELVSGTLAGRSGSFLLRHAAQADGTDGWMTWQVVPGSGTGELAGVRGEGQITRLDGGNHRYGLDLLLP
jgi:hypothetical protein